jgi:integrase
MKVTIENLEGRLRLRWTCPETGKRKNLALGVDDSTTGRAFAATVKDRIENDAKHGYYDPTLLKYRPRTLGKNPTEITTVELFDRFTQHQTKTKGLSKNSIDTRYKYIQRMLEKCLNIRASDVDRRRAEAFVEAGCKSLKPNTAKERIRLLKSAWDWGRGKYQLPDENPWQGIAERFKNVPSQPHAVFTQSEVTQIIQAFRHSRYYSHYADYVAFRFGMGTRPGEASALKWKHVSPDFRSVWIGESFSRGTTGSTKTKKARTVVMPDSIASMLRNRKELLKPQSDDELVFPSPTGLPICDRGFNRRAWRSVLAELGIPYRKPYTTRKTAISHALAHGANYIDVAAAAGHDPQTMHKHYAESIQRGSVFVPFEVG